MAKLMWVISGGGPLLLLPERLADSWSGINPTKDPLNDARFRWNPRMATPSDYDRACDVKEPVALFDIGSGFGLVFTGEGDVTATWLPFADQPGGVVALPRYADGVDATGRFLADNSEAEFVTTGLVLPHTGGVVTLFDSAYPPAQPSKHFDANSLRFRLRAGRYIVTAAAYNAEQDTHIDLIRLTPEADR